MKKNNNKVYSIETGCIETFASLKWFRKVRVNHAFLINDDKIVSSLLNL